MKTVMVRCTYVLPVEFEDKFTDEEIRYFVEEKDCPGTGFVGAAFYKLMEQHEAASTCWACSVDGENILLEKP